MKISKFRFFVFLMTALTVGLFSSALSVTTLSASGAETGSYYLSEKSNVDTVHATTVGALPCIGDAKILVFYTDFKNGQANWTKTKEEVENMFFSQTGKNDPSVAYSDADSLRSYYYRSSYGKVEITGTVYEYQTQNPTSDYNSIHTVLDEIIAYYRDTINWEDYDGNGDGYIDGIYLIARNKHSWGGPNFVGGYSNTVGNKKICKACFLDSCNFSTVCHETCHMFGPADMYAGVSINPSGIQTACIMENGYGDLPSATKFVLGWLDHATFVSSDHTGTYQLRSYTNYGDCLIVYPNGDPTNRNWFFVEYVTNEGNNCEEGSQGLRVWKTQMNLDENYDIIGAKDFCYGSPSSPYFYLESIHPDGVWNYYMQTGQKISPYTYPSTAYSDTFYHEGGAAILKDLTFSGIEIAFSGLADKTATVDVHIEAQADVSENIDATLARLSSGGSSAFLDNKNLIGFASLSSDAELKINAPITLSSKSGDRVYTLETKQSKNKREILLYITPSMLNSLKEQSDWTVSVSNVTTYYGASLNVGNSAETFDFSSYPTPLIDCDGTYNTNFNMSYEYELKCFRISDSVILTVFYDDTVKKLYWGEIDTQTNTTEKYELLLPEDIVIEEWVNNETISVWQDHNTYFVHIGNYVCGYSDKTLISSFDLSTVGNFLTFKGTDNSSLFVDRDNKIYEMGFDGNVITLATVPVDISDVGFYRVENIYSFLENQYIITYDNMVRVVDIGKNTVKELSYADNNPRGYTRTAVYFSDGRYYVFASSADLIMYEYDTEFRLLKETCILKDLSSTVWGPFKINVRFYNRSWVIYFESVSNENAISYANTYLILCDENGKVTNYYKYGDSSFAFVCQFVPVSQYKFIGVKAFSFMYVRSGCEQHVYGEWTQTLAPTCTAEGSERRECTLCNHFETRAIAAKGHTEVIDAGKVPTCTETGLTEGKHCSVCGVVLTAQNTIEAKGHTEVIDAAKKPTCTETGLTEGKHCAVCGVVLIAQNTIAATGHTEVIDPGKKPTCTETGLTEGKHCSVCHAVLTEQNTIEAKGHTEVIIAGKKPTCTENGLTEGKHCSVCGEVLIAQNTIEATGHTEVIDVAKKPTCTETGLTEGKHCAVCHTVLTAQKMIAATGHTEVIVAGKKPTCTKSGLTEGKHCAVCGEVLIAQNTIAAKGHIEVIDAGKRPTCTETGLTEGKHCSVCHAVLMAQNTIAAKGHTEVIVAGKKPTCTENGLTEGKHCSVCGEVTVAQEVVAKLAHKSSEWLIDTQATCSAAGSKHIECTVCHEVLETQVIEKLEHNPSDWIIDTQVTCSAVGSKHKECTVCHEVLETQEIEKLEHNPSDWITDTQVTCSAVGSKHKECTVCHEVLETQEIEKLEHNPSDWITDTQATCSAAGSKHIECTVCHEVLETQELEKLEHNPSDWIIDTQATCSAAGSKHKECTECHEVLEAQAIEKLEHKSSEWLVDAQATCSTAGSKHIECMVCHEVLETQAIEKLEHKSSEWLVDAQATCSAVGSKHKECTVCHEVLEAQAIEKLEHKSSEWLVDAQATCSAAGSKHIECTVCHEVLETQELEKLEHNPSDWLVDAQATCSTAGSKHKECTACHEVLETQAIEKLEHKSSEWLVDAQATCSTAGSRHNECTECHEVLETQEIEKLEHRFGEWETVKEATDTECGESRRVCSQCGAAESKVIPQKEKKGCKSDMTSVAGCAALGLAAIGSVLFLKRKRT